MPMPVGHILRAAPSRERGAVWHARKAVTSHRVAPSSVIIITSCLAAPCQESASHDSTVTGVVVTAQWGGRGEQRARPRPAGSRVRIKTFESAWPDLDSEARRLPPRLRVRVTTGHGRTVPGPFNRTRL